MSDNLKQKWDNHVSSELVFFAPILKNLGFAVDFDQPHIKGERYAFRSKKLVLVGYRIDDHKKVIIKITRHKEGKYEIQKERDSKNALQQIDFAYHSFHSPQEILFLDSKDYTIFITEFLVEEKKFLERNVKDQFFLALQAFETQEGVHTVTKKHKNISKKLFEIYDAKKYLKEFNNYKKNILKNFENLYEILESAEVELKKNIYCLKQYNSFLSHSDFVPHNFRVVDSKIFLLDASAIRIGNKYDSWARFLNYMILYNRQLEKYLIQFIKDNRSPEELEALKLMRILRLTELIHHHVKIYTETHDELKVLSKKRVEFWTKVLKSILNNQDITDEEIREYKNERDVLRTPDEKERQKDLH